jgi:hypothetical protein
MPAFRTCLALLFCACLTATAWSDELRTLSGKTIKGTVTAVSDKAVTLKTETGDVATPLSDILALDLRPVTGVPAGTEFAEVRLVDGSTLRCADVALKGKEAELKLLNGQTVKVGLDKVVTYLLGAHKAEFRKEWESLLGEKLKRDRLLVAADDELKSLECTVKGVDAKGESIDVRRDGNKDATVPLSRLQGIIFFRDDKVPGDVVCQVVDVQGNSLAATKVAVDGGNITVTTAGGAKLTYDAKNIARFDYNLGKLTYLSDMLPAKAPVRKSRAGVFDTFSDELCKDRTLDHEDIKVDGKTVPKGLTLRAYTEVEYDLGGKYKKFRAVLAVLPPLESEQAGVYQPRVTIELDGAKKFSQVITVKGTVPLDLNVEGVQRLRIIVSSSNLLDLYDNVTLADAKVTQ